MQKIPTLFLRGPNRKVTPEPHPDCAWVFDGEGIATEKFDGTNVRLTLRSGSVVRLEKRRNPSKRQKAEGIIEPWYVDADELAPEDKYIWEAVADTVTDDWPDGEHCCEAIGPKIQGNPLGLYEDVCMPFDLDKCIYEDVPRAFAALKAFLENLDSIYNPGHLAEGIVFHHPDGRRAKIKRKDFDYGR